MRVQCPNCGSGGNIPDEKIPASGTKIVCPKCKTAFFVQSPASQAQSAQDASIPYKEGVKLLKERRVDAAIEKFNLAIQANAQYGEAYRYLGIAYGQKNLWAEAAQVLQNAVECNPDDLQSLKNLGIAYLKQKQFVKAETVLQQARQHAPDDEKIRSYLAMAAKGKQQQPATAQTTSQASPPQQAKADSPPDPAEPRTAANTAPPRDPVAELLDRGVEYLDNAQYNKAIEAFNEVCRIAPQTADGYAGLAMVYEKREDWAKAIDAYQHVLQVNPEDTIARDNLKFAKKQTKKLNLKFWKK
jgi:predicted Zn finger-like uncharacterized protein